MRFRNIIKTIVPKTLKFGHDCPKTQFVHKLSLSVRHLLWDFQQLNETLFMVEKFKTAFHCFTLIMHMHFLFSLFFFFLQISKCFRKIFLRPLQRTLC